ncbi:MAG: YbhB/YbcL family Raf kinase inhibitor-like protein [Oceanococcaceae bacterium]
MHVFSPSFEPGQLLPDTLAVAQPDPAGGVTLAANRNPALTWEDVPAETQSFALSCIDNDAPIHGDDVNQPGREVSDMLARCEFVHWLVADLPADLRHIEEGAWSAGVVARGKSTPSCPVAGCMQGQNDYTGWFASDPDMRGTYHGYDGPCPPWNDARIHHYTFRIYALDQPRLELPPGFGLGAFRTAIDGHVLASAQIQGVFTLNPRLRDASPSSSVRG